MDSWNFDVNKITDLIAIKSIEGKYPLSVLKLHKLLYYTEAWHVTLFEKKLFDEDFQAWVHGPVCPEIFKRFRDQQKLLYSEVTLEDLNQWSEGEVQNYDHVILHIKNVLDVYGKFSGIQLEELTHREPPWQKARGNLPFDQRCTEVISKESMRDYYHSQLIKEKK